MQKEILSTSKFSLGEFSQIFKKMGILEPVNRIHWSRNEKTAWCVTTTHKLITVFLEGSTEIFLEVGNVLYIYRLSKENEPILSETQET